MIPVPTSAQESTYLSLAMSNAQSEADLALQDKVVNGMLASEEADRALKRDALAQRKKEANGMLASAKADLALKGKLANAAADRALQEKVANGKLASAAADRRNALAMSIIGTGGFITATLILSNGSLFFDIRDIAVSFRRFLEMLEGRTLLSLMFSPFRSTNISNEGEGEGSGTSGSPSRSKVRTWRRR